jgi:RsiW-degrading membrane proteinase PrsW (M82 family)
MFWLGEDREKPEPRRLIVATFIAGMLGVLLVIPLQKIANGIITDHNHLIVIWAFIEEIMKLALVILIIRPTYEIEQPVDYAIYLIVVGLGFAALENTLYIIKPLLVNDGTVVFLTGNLRFMGSTLLHATASSLIGIVIGLSFFQNRFIKYTSAILGLGLATLLHSTFNFFIMKGEGKSTLQIFIFLWVTTTLVILLFEKLRRMSGEYEPLEDEY